MHRTRNPPQDCQRDVDNERCTRRGNASGLRRELLFAKRPRTGATPIRLNPKIASDQHTDSKQSKARRANEPRKTASGGKNLYNKQITSRQHNPAHHHTIITNPHRDKILNHHPSPRLTPRSLPRRRHWDPGQPTSKQTPDPMTDPDCGSSRRRRPNPLADPKANPGSLNGLGW